MECFTWDRNNNLTSNNDNAKNVAILVPTICFVNYKSSNAAQSLAAVICCVGGK